MLLDNGGYGTPDANLKYKDFLSPLVVEVGYMHSPNALRNKVDLWIDQATIKTVIAFNLPYQKPAERLQRRGITCTVYRAVISLDDDDTKHWRLVKSVHAFGDANSNIDGDDSDLQLSLNDFLPNEDQLVGGTNAKFTIPHADLKEMFRRGASEPARLRCFTLSQAACHFSSEEEFGHT